MEIKLFNESLERIIIGSLLKKNSIITDLQNIKKDYFFNEANKFLIGTIIDYVNNNKYIDQHILISYKNKQEFTTEIEDDYINNMLVEAIGVYDIEPYFKELKDLYIKRQLKTIGETINKNINKNISTEKLLDNIKNEISSYSDISCDFSSNLKIIGDLVEKEVNILFSSEENEYLKTDLIDFDNKFIGLPRQKLTILAGATSMGKSTVAAQIGLNIAKNGFNVLFFSEEQTNSENSKKTISNYTGIDTYYLNSKKIYENQKKQILDALKEIKNINFFIDDKAKITPGYIKKTTQEFIRKYGKVDLIIVDHLQITEDDEKSRSLIEKYGNITLELKKIAKETNSSVLCLSQLSRKVEENEGAVPSLSNLRDSGNIEQNADLVVFVYRKFYYLEKGLERIDEKDKRYLEYLKKMGEYKNQCDLLIQKNRNGTLGKITLFCDLSTSKIKNYSNK